MKYMKTVEQILADVLAIDSSSALMAHKALDENAKAWRLTDEQIIRVRPMIREYFCNGPVNPVDCIVGLVIAEKPTCESHAFKLMNEMIVKWGYEFTAEQIDTIQKRLSVWIYNNRNKIESGLPNHKYNKYFRNVGRYKQIDVYRVLKLFGVTDPAIAHAIKKLLLMGVRTGGKSELVDLREAIDTLKRCEEMVIEDNDSSHQH